MYAQTKSGFTPVKQGFIPVGQGLRPQASGFTPIQSGFTLVELLVTISVVALLLGIAVPNYVGARSRGTDAKKKQELGQLKNALRLYYNDFQRFPAASGDNKQIFGCGASGDEGCPPQTNLCPKGEEFGAGGTGCATVYMSLLPKDFVYYPQNPNRPTADSFVLKTKMENPSQVEIRASQKNCGYPTTQESNFYYICAD